MMNLKSRFYSEYFSLSLSQINSLRIKAKYQMFDHGRLGSQTGAENETNSLKQ